MKKDGIKHDKKLKKYEDEDEQQQHQQQQIHLLLRTPSVFRPCYCYGRKHFFMFYSLTTHK